MCFSIFDKIFILVFYKLFYLILVFPLAHTIKTVVIVLDQAPGVVVGFGAVPGGAVFSCGDRCGAWEAFGAGAAEFAEGAV